MSTAVIRIFVTGIIISAIATGLSTQVFKTGVLDTGTLSILALLFFLSSITTALVATNKHGK